MVVRVTKMTGSSALRLQVLLITLDYNVIVILHTFNIVELQHI
jgi:hypothetical protein